MFIVSLVLFLAGLLLFGVAYMPFVTVPLLSALIFAAGILCVCLAMALPIHSRATK